MRDLIREGTLQSVNQKVKAPIYQDLPTVLVRTVSRRITAELVLPIWGRVRGPIWWEIYREEK